MLKQDIALQAEARSLSNRGGGRGGNRGRGSRGRGNRGGKRGGLRGGGRGGGDSGHHNHDNKENKGGNGKKRDRDSGDDYTPPKRGRTDKASKIVMCSMIRGARSTPRHWAIDGVMHALIDSGCTSHITRHETGRINVREVNKQVQLADGTKHRVRLVGDMPIKSKSKHGNWISALFKGVLVCPAIKGTIFSTNKWRMLSTRRSVRGGIRLKSQRQEPYFRNFLPSIY